jgi:hypothetical protein
MKEMPSRDTTGTCIGDCRDRVFEGELEGLRFIRLKRTLFHEAP